MEKIIKYLEKHNMEYDRKYNDDFGPVIYVYGKENENKFIPYMRIGMEKKKNKYYVRNCGWIYRDYPYKRVIKDIKDLFK